MFQDIPDNNLRSCFEKPMFGIEFQVRVGTVDILLLQFNGFSPNSRVAISPDLQDGLAYVRIPRWQIVLI